MSLHNSCSAIKKFSLSEGSLGFVLGARDLPESRILECVSTKLPTFSCTFGALIYKNPLFSRAFSALICKDPTFNTVGAVLLHFLSTFSATHLQRASVFLYFWCTHLPNSLVFQCFWCTAKSTGTLSNPCACTEQDPANPPEHYRYRKQFWKPAP